MRRNSARVLVVEDDASVREAVDAALRAEGYDVISLPDGTEVGAKTASFHPDIAVLDVRLPIGPSGLSIARVLREDLDLPLLMLTAADGVDDRLAGFEAGADDYLVKPFAMPELLARVHALLRRSGRVSTEIWQLGDLVVDAASRKAHRGDRSLDLTPTEFDLLLALHRNSHRVVSKSQLLAAIWGFEDADSNLVEVHISSLRRKLEVDGPRMIDTVRGLGYRLHA